VTAVLQAGRRYAAPVLLLGVLGACGETDPPTVQLRFEYREGDTLRYEYEASGTYTIPDTAAPGRPSQRTYERAMRIEELAQDVTPSGNYRLAVTYYLAPDTAAQSEPPAPVTILIEMTPQGRILDVTGVETARPIFGDIDFESYFEQAQPVFPDRPLKVGDSWTQEVKVVGAGSEPVVTSSTYVLKALSREDGEPVATIVFDGEIYLPLGHDAARGESQLAEERIRVHGTFTFAHERGIMRYVQTSARATVSRLAVGNGQTTRRDLHIEEESMMRLVEE